MLSMGNGGSKPKQEEIKKIETEIMNSTTVQNTIKQYNETINETMMKSVQATVTNASQSASAEQSVQSGINVKGGGNVILTAEDVDMDMEAKVDFSSLAKSEIQQEALQNTVNDLQKKMTKDLEAAASGSASQTTDQPDPLSKMIDAAADVMGSVTSALGGGQDKMSKEERKTSIKNHLNISNTTEIENKVRNTVKAETVNEMIQNLSSKVSASQKLQSDINAEDIDNFIASVKGSSMKMSIEAAMDVVTQSGASTTLMSDLLNVDKTKIEDAISASTEAESAQTERGAITQAGGAVSEAAQGIGTGVGNVVGSFGGSAMIAPIIGLVISSSLAAGVFFMMKQQGVTSALGGGKKRGGYKMKGGNPQLKQLERQVVSMGTRAYNAVANFVRNPDNQIIVALLIIAVVLIALRRTKEYFSSDKNFYLKHNGLYLNTNLCFKQDKDEQAIIEMLPQGDNKMYLTMYKKKEYLTVNINGQLVLDKFGRAHAKDYEFVLKNKKLRSNKTGQFVGVKNECMRLVDNEADAIILEAEY